MNVASFFGHAGIQGGSYGVRQVECIQDDGSFGGRGYVLGGSDFVCIHVHLTVLCDPFFVRFIEPSFSVTL